MNSKELAALVDRDSKGSNGEDDQRCLIFVPS